MYFHRWSDVTQPAIFFLEHDELRRHSAVSFHSEVQQIAISPFFPRFPYLSSLCSPTSLFPSLFELPSWNLLLFNDRPLSSLSDTRVDCVSFSERLDAYTTRAVTCVHTWAQVRIEKCNAIRMKYQWTPLKWRFKRLFKVRSFVAGYWPSFTTSSISVVLFCFYDLFDLSVLTRKAKSKVTLMRWQIELIVN